MAKRFLSNIRINDAYTFPASDGTNNQVIKTDGSGNLSFGQLAADSASVMYKDTFTGDGSTTGFTLSNALNDEVQSNIYIDGVYQSKSTYSVSGTAITFSTAPLSGHEIEVISTTGINSGPTAIYTDTFTANGSSTAFTLGQTVHSENQTIVFLNGVYQFKGTYILSGTTLTLDTAPSNGVSIEVMSIGSAYSGGDILYDHDFTSAGLMTTDGSGVYSITANNSANWNTAYGWGDHGLSAQDKTDIGNLSGTNTGDQDLSSYATQSYVGTQISNLVDSSPATLNTLNELAAALGDDPNFATTTANSIGTKLPLAGGTLTGGLTGTTAGFSGSINASGNSNSFGNTTIGALAASTGTFSASVTAAGNSNSFGTSTFAGNVTLAKAVGDTELLIEADTNNNNENYNPRLHLRQDGGAISAYFGLNGDTDNTFTGALANGAYIKAAGSIQFANGSGTDLAMTIDTSQNVGIGTTSVFTSNHILNLSGTGIAIKNDTNGSSNNWSSIKNTSTSSGSNLVFQTATGTNTMNDAGNFGIGGEPSVNFEIAKSGARIKMIDGTNQFNMGLWDSVNYRFEGDANRPMFFTSYQGNIKLGISGGTTMTIQSSNVGIGTTAPYAKLSVKDGTNINLGIKVGQTDTTAVMLNAYNDAVTANIPMEFRASKFAFQNGNVGIGTDSPVNNLQVKTGSNGGGITIQRNSSTNGSFADLMFSISTSDAASPETKIRATRGASYDDTDITFITSNSERMRIDSSGNVGIGTTSPDEALQIGQGKSMMLGNYFFLGSGDSNYLGAIGFNRDTTNGNIFNSSYGAYQIHNYQGALKLQVYSPAGGTIGEHKFFNNGDVSLINGISFNGDTAAANKLDDYEEGTFQTNVNSTNVTNYSYSGNNGRYTKIGRQVIVTFVISSITAGTGFKYFVISNLPFTQHVASHNDQGYCSSYPRGERRSGIIINNSSGNTSQWYVSYNNNSAQSNDMIRGTIIYTTTQ